MSVKPRKRRQWPLLVGACILAAGAVIFIGDSPFETSTSSNKEVPDLVAATPVPTPTPRVAVEFRMLDLDRGWVKYADGMAHTSDGGAHWQEATSTEALPTDGEAATNGLEAITKLLSLESGTGSAAEGASATATATSGSPSVDIVTLNGTMFDVKQSQFVTPKIGWALLPSTTNSKSPLVLTVDGGQSWIDGMTEDAKAVILGVKAQLAQLKAEALLYKDEAGAKAAMGASWKLIPDQASPGDIVLVRHKEPGSIAWQGKTYTLQPYEAGYFTYLPISMSVKAGTYPIGDQTLTIKAKKFETQYLKVTEQMESMKQDTTRINTDQKKIDLARSKSEPSFLFSGPFVKPIEGILTTPYGYTRYVNGKYDSAHMALDLAAKEGTPIKATNDGVVALAELLYLTGNSIYIDHGMGLFSQYAHLSELRVKPGDRVKQGDIIGLVGTTGFSTGPHLHFTFWAHNIQANPDLFFNTTPFQWVK
ncbi:peptidoglycan DD-metalloendopeptidase family protein [Paenibacillus sp. LMG 31461]|uniref:Peptidoglycan DD-metalloendopeptidase family protein n=1 Tax=Paenibacillus plantarum TaxID=2654975 RepID=A0ABX1XEZ4_9BACL|nr:peptidoglycan DD-metalloendopeptidase family protein [Paenibacillus plantarum]